MIILNIIIILLGIQTSYTDFSFRKIRNRHLLIATISGLAVHTYLFSTGQLTLNLNGILNVFIGLGIGLLLYLTDTWGGGDAKLFAVLCFLLPTEKYSQLLFFPALAIFANIFLIGSLGILIFSVKEIFWNQKTTLNLSASFPILAKLGRVFLAIFSFRWAVKQITDRVIPESNHFLSPIILFFTYRIISWLIKKKLHNNRLVVPVLVLGGATQFIINPDSFNLPSLFSQFHTILLYSILFYSIDMMITKNSPDDASKRPIPFAPFMTLGALLTNTNFLNWVIQLLNFPKR